MKFTLRVDDGEHQVEARTDGVVILDGEEFMAKVASPAGDRRTVQVGDRTYEIRVVETGDAGDRKEAREGGSEGRPGTGQEPEGSGAGQTAVGTYLLEIAGERVAITAAGLQRGVGPTAGAGEPGVSVGASLVAAGGAGGASGAEVPGGAASPPPAVEGVKDGIYAPVPGKIVDVVVKVGDVVEPGGLVLILEAMKMENELHAAKRGTVTAVLVKKGDQAERGQLLVALD